MQADAVAHQFRRDEIAFQNLADGEAAKNDQDHMPRVSCHSRDGDGDDRSCKPDHRAQIRDERQHACHNADQRAKIQSGNR